MLYDAVKVVRYGSTTIKIILFNPHDLDVRRCRITEETASERLATTLTKPYQVSVSNGKCHILYYNFVVIFHMSPD